MKEQTSNLRIFCGYASKDKKFCLDLEKALAAQRHQELISFWHHGEILPGSEWDREIWQQLHNADIILLLISPDFLSSEYSWNKELQWAIALHRVDEACVIPVLLRPTAGWESTPLGELQALPAGKKPVTRWPTRDEAYENIVLGLKEVIGHFQQKERYSIKDYTIELRPFVYDSWPEKTIAEEAAKQQAEQWLDLISQEGSIQSLARHGQETEWSFINPQGNCHITTQWQTYKGVDQFNRPFCSSTIILTSQSLTLLDQLIEVGKLPYHFFQWTLCDDLDIPTLAQRIYSQTGKEPSSRARLEKAYHIEYGLRNESELFLEKQAIRITLSSKGAIWPSDPHASARICLIHDNFPLNGFYRAHKILSVRKLLKALRGDIPHMQFWQLIDEACLMESKREVSKPDFKT